MPADCRLCMILCVLCSALLPIAPALGQEAFELSDDGQWERAEAFDPTTPEGQLQVIRRTLEEGDADAAEELIESWLRRFPDHPGRAEARLHQGDVKMLRGRYYRALFDYEYVIRVHPDSPAYHQAIQREFDIAQRFIDGWRRPLLGLPILPTRSEGEEILIRIQERAPGSRLGEQASITLADFYYDRQRWSMAAEAFSLFLQNYPRSEQREYAMRQMIFANLNRYQGPEFDPTGLIEAQQRLALYRDAFPAHAEELDADELEAEITAQRAEKDFTVARWYERRGEPVGAAYMYQRVIADHPDTESAEQARGRLEGLNLPVLPEIHR